MGNNGVALLDHHLEVVERTLQDLFAVGRPQGLGLRPDPGIGQELADEPLHPGRAIDGTSDELIGIGIEPALIGFRQELREAHHLAQRFLQVVRGHVGELLQLGVGPAQLGRALPDPLLELVVQGADLFLGTLALGHFLSQHRGLVLEVIPPYRIFVSDGDL